MNDKNETSVEASPDRQAQQGARITAGYHHGLSEGDVVKIGRTFFRVANVGAEAFNVAKLPWYIALWWHIKSAWLHLKHSLPNKTDQTAGENPA